MFEPICGFNFTDLGDYIETGNAIEASFMALDWFESAMSDPFYVLTTDQIAESAQILNDNGIEVTA